MVYWLFFNRTLSIILLNLYSAIPRNVIIACFLKAKILLSNHFFLLKYLMARIHPFFFALLHVPTDCPFEFNCFAWSFTDRLRLKKRSHSAQVQKNQFIWTKCVWGTVECDLGL